MSMKRVGTFRISTDLLELKLSLPRHVRICGIQHEGPTEGDYVLITVEGPGLPETPEGARPAEVIPILAWGSGAVTGFRHVTGEPIT